MYLGGQANQRGYAMAAVLVAIALMSVVMLALLPAWRQQGQREKEAELAFRGEQYARAVLLYRRKFPGASPMTIDALVEGRFLRKKYKDPMTGEDFQPLYLGQQPGQPPPQGRGVPQGRGGQPGQPQGGGVGITGVVSKSKENSIRIYRGASTYNAWNFIDPIGNRGRGAGPGGAPGQGGPGGRGPGTGGPAGGFDGRGGRGIGPGVGPGIGPGGGRGPGPGGGRGPVPGGGRGPVFPGGGRGPG